MKDIDYHDIGWAINTAMYEGKRVCRARWMRDVFLVCLTGYGPTYEADLEKGPVLVEHRFGRYGMWEPENVDLTATDWMEWSEARWSECDDD